MLEAYCWPRSAVPGDRVGVHVSSDSPTVTVTVARDGLEPTEVWRAEHVAAGRHEVPEEASSNGCDWPVALDIAVGDWRARYYPRAGTPRAERAHPLLVVRGRDRPPP